MEADGKNPRALTDKPTLYEWMGEYLKAFDVLSATRQFGMGPSPIQLSEMLAYIKLYEPEDRDAFIHHILVMDRVFLQEMAKKQEKKG